MSDLYPGPQIHARAPNDRQQNAPEDWTLPPQKSVCVPMYFVLCSAPGAIILFRTDPYFSAALHAPVRSAFRVVHSELLQHMPLV